MNKQTLQLAQMMIDPRITAKPLWALAKLRAKGVRRVPDAVLQDLRKKGGQGRALDFIRQWLDGELFTRHNGQWVLNSFLPPFPGPAYDRMFENLFSGRHLSPVSAFLAITAECPCVCSHCSARCAPAEELTTASWIDALQQLQELGTSIVGFTGGEPLERADLPKIIEECARLGMASILFTSGAGVSSDKIAKLKTAGLWACCVSLDYDAATEHDRLRGRVGVFEEALETLRLANAAGLYSMASSVATRSFIASRMFERIHALCREHGVHEYRIVEPMPCGALADAKEETLLSPELVQILRDFHVQTNRAQEHPKVCAFNQIESPEIFGCGAGTQHLYIQADGTIRPCDFMPLGFGNLKTDALANVWKRMNLAMGDNPRSHCFIQKHHERINRHASDDFPLSPEDSEALCMEVGSEPMPGYFAMVTGQPKENAK